METITATRAFTAAIAILLIATASIAAKAEVQQSQPGTEEPECALTESVSIFRKVMDTTTAFTQNIEDLEIQIQTCMSASEHRNQQALCSLKPVREMQIVISNLRDNELIRLAEAANRMSVELDQVLDELRIFSEEIDERIPELTLALETILNGLKEHASILDSNEGEITLSSEDQKALRIKLIEITHIEARLEINNKMRSRLRVQHEDFVNTKTTALDLINLARRLDFQFALRQDKLKELEWNLSIQIIKGAFNGVEGAQDISPILQDLRLGVNEAMMEIRAVRFPRLDKDMHLQFLEPFLDGAP